MMSILPYRNELGYLYLTLDFELGTTDFRVYLDLRGKNVSTSLSSGYIYAPVQFKQSLCSSA